jgi:peptidoglycan hydrolase CwlO-like protein
MPDRPRRTLLLRLLVAVAALGALLASSLVSSSSGDLQRQIDASRSAASALKSQIAAESAKISQTAGGIEAERSRLSAVQAELDARITELRTVQSNLVASRTRLVALENRLRVASAALAANLVAKYEGNTPDLMSVILESHGFRDLLERVSFLKKIGRQDAVIVGDTRTARAQVTAEVQRLAGLETRDRNLTEDVLQKRNQIAAIQGALIKQQIMQLGHRSADNAQLNALNGRLATLEKRAADQAARARAAAMAVNRSVGGIAVDTGGMVQPPPGAPPQVAEVIAAGNAIASLPYIWGGGHGSFQASGYDCSGSVSYALAAAGLLSSPLDSTGFESWGEPGPGRWITVYANAGHAWMMVAGWRFDTVALASGGTRWSQGGGEYSGFVVRHPAGL